MSVSHDQPRRDEYEFEDALLYLVANSMKGVLGPSSGCEELQQRQLTRPAVANLLLASL